MPHIGVLIVPPIQLLDVAPVDLFSMLTTSYMRACKVPDALLAHTISDSSMRITYIVPSTSTESNTSQSTDGANHSDGTAMTTAHLRIASDATTSSPTVAPGKLDILLIPGPPPGQRPTEDVLEFVRAHVSAGVDLLTICTGVFVAGFAGVLDGKNVVGGREVLPILRGMFPSAKWTEKRWQADGKVWTAGGITNGMDMVAVYLREKYPGPLTETALKMADVVVRDQNYADA